LPEVDVSIAYFITHPEVVVEATTPVPQWHLSDKGVHRMRAFASQADLGNLSAVWASTETKAIEAAGILAGRFGFPVHVHRELHENDRSATGFLPPPEFDRMADAFFARPEENVRGWERAVDAQARVVAVPCCCASISECRSRGVLINRSRDTSGPSKLKRVA
jgi:broad specificity phosphatase PhoE